MHYLLQSNIKCNLDICTKASYLIISDLFVNIHIQGNAHARMPKVL